MRTTRMLMIGLLAACLTAGAAAHATDPAAGRTTVMLCAEVRMLPQGTPLAQRTQLGEIAARLRSGDQAGAIQRWEAFAASYFTASNKGLAPQIQNWLLREGVLETVPAVAIAADKVRFLGEQQREVRRELAALREARSANPTPHPVAHAVLTAIFSKGSPAVASRSVRTLTVPQIDLAIKDLETKLKTLGDDAALANIDLQDVLQKQQELIQVISNISKLLNDTALAVIRKIG